MPADIYFDQLSRSWEEEGLFARDINGQLIRVVAKTEEDYSKFVTVTVDGQQIQVAKAVPTTDAQGNIICVDAAGRTIPRATTIYDAARQLVDRTNAERRRTDPKAALAEVSIPTVCHLDHMKPVGVCRVCSVAAETFEIDPKDPTKLKPKRQEKLVPACVQPVEDHMIVHTLASPDAKQRGKVEASVRVLLELLASDHLPPEAVHNARPEQLSDLERILHRFGDQLKLKRQRFKPHKPLSYPKDDSSPLILVDHNACILCDRCVRACTDVKENFVIGRNGKGYSARIGFDLNDPMGDSSCVECGECMLSCPTTALTFRKPVESDWAKEQLGEGGRGGVPGKSAVTPIEMEDNILLRTLPWRYRQWNQSAVLRWKLKAGEELCAVGEYGSTAFILNSGEFGVWRNDPRMAGGNGKGGGNGQGSNGAVNWGQPELKLSPADLIVGEMTCLNQYPRTATVRALTDGEVFEVRRNVLFTLQRSPEARELLDNVYRTRAISNHLRRVPLFAQLDEADRKRCLQILESAPSGEAAVSENVSAAAALPRRKVDLVRVEPGQTIFRQGEKADCFYMIRLGYVKVSKTLGGEERTIDYLGPDRSFGEIACIGDWEEMQSLAAAERLGPLDNRRTASCAALDDVEVVRIDSETFRELLAAVPALKKLVIQQARDYLRQDRPEIDSPVEKRHASPLLEEFTTQGLFNGQRLLVLDLEACTRCDECTKACSDTHDGVTRLIRDGLRFDKWLVASSCRSCTDPYCLVGCPVDAIHRGGETKEITIESHCIGCGLCADNCPYGNINMHASEEYDKQRSQAVVRYKATTCDLCSQIVGGDYKNVSCVFACPHNAAFRMEGPELLKLVEQS